MPSVDVEEINTLRTLPELAEDLSGLEKLGTDVSKAGGVTELLRIANLMSGWNISINPHTSLTAINMAVSIHILASIENGGYFEGDVTNYNPFRDDMSVDPFKLDKNGFVEPLDIPGTGVDIDEKFLSKYPLIDGPCYI